MKKMKKICPSCGGVGQISYFQGVSRFLLTTEECPECYGLGYVQDHVGAEERNKNKTRSRKKRKNEET